MCNLIFLSFWGENVADYAFRTLEDRQKIEKLREDGRTPKEISETRGVPVHVDYNERTRGQDGARLPDQRLRYSADVAQRRVQVGFLFYRFSRLRLDRRKRMGM